MSSLRVKTISDALECVYQALAGTDEPSQGDNTITQKLKSIIQVYADKAQSDISIPEEGSIKDYLNVLSEVVFANDEPGIADRFFEGSKNVTIYSESIAAGIFSIPYNDTDPDSEYYECGIVSLSAPNVTSLDEKAFKGCTSLKRLSLPKLPDDDGSDPKWLWDTALCEHLEYLDISSFETICDEFFSYMDMLKEVKLEGAKNIGNSAFQACVLLEHVYLPNAINIGASAFAACASLESLALPNITNIPNNLCAECTELEHFEAPNATSADTDCLAFDGCNNLKTIIVPKMTDEGIYDGGITAPNLEYLDISSATYIMEDWFNSDGNIKTVIMPNVQTIGPTAFNYCTSLVLTELPSGLTSIGDCGFRGCSSIISLHLPDSLIDIGDEVFADCTSLESITLPNGLSSIRDSLFKNCSSLQTITLPSGIRSIGVNSFAGCTSLVSIDISEVESVPICDYNFADITCVFLAKDQSQIDAWIASGDWSGLASRFQIKGES